MPDESELIAMRAKGIVCVGSDDRPLVRCSFCIDGHVYAGVYDRLKRCLVCLGTGRIPALDCPLCCEPLADDHSKVYSVAGAKAHKAPLGSVVHPSVNVAADTE